MKVALVGSAGFFGKSLVERKNDFELIQFNRQYLPWDDKFQLRSTFKECRSIIWAATSINPKMAEVNPALVEAELEDWHKFLDQLSNSETKQNVLLLSSGGCVYTDRNLPFTEASESLGINRYGKFKIQQEKSLMEAFPESTVVRLSNIYGTGQPHGRGQGVIAEWVYAIRNRMPLKLFGDPETSRDYLHVFDAVSAVSSLAISEENGYFNVGHGTATSLNKILEILNDVAEEDFSVEFHPGRPFDRNFYQLSIDKILQKTSWSPKISIEEGIKKIFASDKI
jgi:UDP-glucose 4-epimerase